MLSRVRLRDHVHLYKHREKKEKRREVIVTERCNSYGKQEQSNISANMPLSVITEKSGQTNTGKRRICDPLFEETENRLRPQTEVKIGVGEAVKHGLRSARK